MDDFYLPRNRRGGEHKTPGRDLDRERLIAQVLDPLTKSEEGCYQRYDWDLDKLAEWHAVSPHATIVVEGTYSTSAMLRHYFSYRVWVECPYDTRLERGVARDGEAMRATWTGHWMPAEDRYVALEDPVASHLVVDGGAGAEEEVRFTVVRSSGAEAPPARAGTPRRHQRGFPSRADR